MSYETIKYQELQNSTIIRVTLNRVKALNAMNFIFFRQIEQIFKKINTLQNARVVILQAEGRLFTAGLDLKQAMNLFNFSGDQDAARKAVKIYSKVKQIQQAFVAVYQCRLPVVTGIHNLCVGGGIDLISTTDIRYCTKDAQFTIKEIDIGMAADIGTLQFFPHIMGNQSTFRQLAYTGRIMRAEEAHQIGFVSKIFEDKKALQNGLLETAKTIASKSPIGIYTIKQAIQKGQKQKIYQGLEYIARTNSVMLQTQDMMDAISGFMQKKQPVFSKL